MQLGASRDASIRAYVPLLVSPSEDPVLLERSTIAEILAKTDLVELIGSHVALKRSGQHYVGLCPFHAERTPSFQVRPDRGFFKCFGCGVGGDAIRFIERTESLTFPEAARWLARRVGVHIEDETPQANAQREQREALYAANDIAMRFYHRQLLQAPEAEVARAYCEERGINAASIERFQLGYAPEGWDALTAVLRKNGVADQTAIDAGLTRAGSRGSYDFYRNRLMIPILTLTGEVVAFGGRAFGDEKPKYVNTSTTPIYQKGRLLYGMHLARRSASTAGALIVCEGYLDCIALHQAGFENAVAALGTAFTLEQGELLRRYGGNVYLAFDSDAAGRAATVKALELLIETGCKTRIVEMPAGEDPDSYLHERGTQAFAQLLEASRSSAEYLIDHDIAALQDGFHSADDQAMAAERRVRQQPRSEWDHWRVYIAERLGLAVEDLRDAVSRVRLPQDVRAANARTAAMPRSDAPQRRQAPIRPSRDREMLAVFVEAPVLLAEYRDRIAPERFREERFRRLYEVLLAAERLETSVDVLVAVAQDPWAQEAFLALSNEERSSTVHFSDISERRQKLDYALQALQREDDEQRRRELHEQMDTLLSAGTAIPHEILTELHAIEGRLFTIQRFAK